MSNMKCPVCKTGNVKQGKYDKEYFCDNAFCPSYDETDSKTYDMLIRTRKSLEIAVDALDRMAVQDSIYDIIARNAMKRIKALEQKD